MALSFCSHAFKLDRRLYPPLQCVWSFKLWSHPNGFSGGRPNGRALLRHNWLEYSGPFCQSAIAYINHCIYRPLYLSTIVSISHRIYQPSYLSTMAFINHCIYQPLYISTIASLNHCIYRSCAKSYRYTLVQRAPYHSTTPHSSRAPL